MTVERLQALRPYPNFKSGLMPESEREHANALRVNIGDMHARATQFWAARMLFASCAERRVFDFPNDLTYHQWQLCAARDAMMSIYHFRHLIEGVDQSLGSCPTLRASIDVEAVRRVRRSFDTIFPKYVEIRHAISHSAERSNTVRALKAHGQKGCAKLDVTPQISIVPLDADGTTLILDGIHGTTFHTMWKGQLVKCEVSDASGSQLDAITDAYWEAFDSVIDPTPEAPPTVTIGRLPGLG